MTGGTANPEVDDAISALAEEKFTYWAFPWTDAANLNALDTELESRWGPMRQIAAWGFTAMRGTLSETSTFGNTRNEKLMSITGTNQAPTQPCVWAATLAAVAAYYLNIDPARPLQTLELPGLLPPAFDKRWTRAERNVLLHDGISTYDVDTDGAVRIERVITTYQTNPYGVDDPSYLDINTLATLSYVRDQVRARVSMRYGRHKLAQDGTPHQERPGHRHLPGTIRAELVGAGQADAGRGDHRGS